LSYTTFKNDLKKYALELKVNKRKEEGFEFVNQMYNNASSHLKEQYKSLNSIKKDIIKIKTEIENKNVYEKCHKGCRIIIRKGDLCDEREDAIVNPANEQLRHEGGAAKAIANRGGEVIQAQSQAYILKHSTLPTGFCTTTDSGNLYCKKVIHAVGPVYRNKVNDQIERELMRTTISNIMMELKEQGLKSISIPAISTGIFNFPRDKCASIMGTVIKEHINSDPYFVGCRIVLCNFDEETTKVMLEIIPNIIEAQDIREEGTMISDGSEKKEEIEDSDKEGEGDDADDADDAEDEEEKSVKSSKRPKKEKSNK
jgi:O-acetyl-ADP-ribose deacetylase (regulator of RNase III)